MNEIYKNNHHRYTSWELCFQVFHDNNLDNKIKALHLAGYLCSWGMYRGSSKLLNNYNYFIFKDLVPVLDKYIFLRKELLDDGDYENFFNLTEEIRDFLMKKNISDTDTLITKIILGVFGNFPALDDYFKKGYRKTFDINISIKQKNTFIKFYNSLKSFYSRYILVFEEQKANIFFKRKIYYPSMKLLDMYFWEEGNKYNA